MQEYIKRAAHSDPAFAEWASARGLGYDLRNGAPDCAPDHHSTKQWRFYVAYLTRVAPYSSAADVLLRTVYRELWVV